MILIHQFKHVFGVLKTTFGSFEPPQHTFWLINKNNYFEICTLIWKSDSLFYSYQDFSEYCVKEK